MNNNITLTEQPSGQFSLVQLTFGEDRYCERRALGRPRREAYRYAFPEDKDMIDDSVDSATRRLEKRPEIQARIVEWVLDKTEEEKAVFREDRKWAIDTTRKQLKLLATDPKMFAMFGLKLMEFLGKLEGWFTDRLEITATGSASTTGEKFDETQVEAKIDRLLTMITRYQNQQTENKEN